MHKGLSEPHVLLASSNPFKLLRNLDDVLSVKSKRAIQQKVNGVAIELYRLGESHHSFAVGLPAVQWRQKISRLYYGAYNAKRAVSLIHDGSFSTESGDHAKVGALPVTLLNHATYSIKLGNLREDRNLCDYSHSAVEADLVISIVDAEVLVTDFLADSKKYLRSRGVSL